ncbi:putative oxidoreductase [Penicillium rolfsii]|nr:putative oxidoreductase [Penicillium rolfsii]
MTPQLEEGANVPPIKVYSDKFAGQVVLVTGAAQGIGAVTAQLFGKQGAHVILLDLQEDRLRSVQDLIVSQKGSASYCVCDISEDRAVQETIQRLVDQFHRIDILAHIAGIYPFSPLVETSNETYHRTISVNVDASFFLTRAILPHMRKQGYGRIIHTSSSTFQEPEVGLSAYVASKAAIIGLVRAASIEAGPGVTVNAVMPGLIRTDQIWDAGVLPDGSHPLFDRVLQKQIVKRCGLPEDIAHTFCFVASPEAAFITGQVLDVSGGETFH